MPLHSPPRSVDFGKWPAVINQFSFSYLSHLGNFKRDAVTEKTISTSGHQRLVYQFLSVSDVRLRGEGGGGGEEEISSVKN